MIQLEQVTKSFGSLKAVNNISLAVREGELFSFLGPNGAGKTTTIKMIVGLMSPDAGKIKINGIDIAKNPLPAKQITGYVPDAPFLYDKLTGPEFLTVIGNLYEMPAEEITSQIETYRERLDLGAWFEEPIESYSQGMRQRVVFVAALLHNPKVLVIDEPMAGLDPKTARRIKDLLKEKTAAGITVFLSTHNLHVAEELSDRIGIIHQGALLSIGSLAALRESLHQQGNLEQLFLQMTEENQGDESER